MKESSPIPDHRGSLGKTTYCRDPARGWQLFFSDFMVGECGVRIMRRGTVERRIVCAADSASCTVSFTFNVPLTI